MKQSAIKKLFVAVAVIIVLLVLIGLVPWRTRTNPTFQFLSGQNPVNREKNESDIKYYYSFEGDFNDVSQKAITELAALGFRNTGASSPPTYDYYRASDKTRVTILDRHRYEAYTTPNNSDYSSPDNGKFHFYEDGWISIVIIQDGPHAPLIRILHNLIRREH